MFVNDVTVDYRSEVLPGNTPPRIKGLGALPDVVYPGHAIRLYCTAVDADLDTLAFVWLPSPGTITGTGPEVTWTASSATGVYAITCVVMDDQGGADSAMVKISVVDSTGPPPVIRRISARPGKVDLNATTLLTCSAYDPSGHPLTYTWIAGQGSVTGSDSTATWTAPGAAGNYVVRCSVNNGNGGVATDSVQLEVRDFRITQAGQLVGYFPFNGNANDESGYENHGTVNGATLVSDHLGSPGQAYSFNGISSWIRVPNSPILNFDSSITVAFWMNVKAFYPGREQYPISHGNWQNRWKISISNPSNKVRWTLKTSTATRDLDSKTPLTLNTDYHLVAVYSGSDFEFYLNGELDAFTPLSGLIALTTEDLSIGRSLPGEAAYSFNGILDDVRIYDYALSYQDIQALYNSMVDIEAPPDPLLPRETALYQNYPNPFNPTTGVRFSVPTQSGRAGQGPGVSDVKLVVFDMLGREVAVLVNERKSAGTYEARFDGSGLASGFYVCRLTAGSAILSRKMLLLR